MLEEGDHLLDHNGCGHALDELGQIVRGLSPHHRCVIVHELGELLAQPFLRLRGGMLVGSVVEAGGGDFGGEPVGFGEADGEGGEVLFDLVLGKLIADVVKRLDGLEFSDGSAGALFKGYVVQGSRYLIPNKGFFDGS